MPQVLNKQWTLSTKKAKQTKTHNIKAEVHNTQTNTKDTQ